MAHEGKQVGSIGDVNFPEYDGGPVFQREDGTAYLEYIEAPDDDIDFDDPNARWTVYRVDLDPEVPTWGSVKAAAKTSGMRPSELEKLFKSDSAMDRAHAHEVFAGHYGWFEFDNYPLVLDVETVDERYGSELAGAIDAGGPDDDEGDNEDED